MYFFYHFSCFFRTQTSQRVSIIPLFEKDCIMQKVSCCQPLKLVSFTMLLWQDAFCQVLYEWVSPVLANEHSITFFSVCCELAGPALGLDLVCFFTHAWPIEACPLKSAVKADLSVRSISLVMYIFQFSLGFHPSHTSGQNPTWHPTIQFSLHQGVVFQCL